MTGSRMGMGFLVAAAGAVLLVGACKNTVEGESKDWTRNTAHVNELIAQYPNFAPALQEQLKSAEGAMAAAKQNSNQQASADQMAAANSLLSGGFVSQLGSVDSSARRVRDKIMTASTTAHTPSDQIAARSAADDAQRILKNTDEQMRQGARDAASASAVLRRIDSELSSAGSNLDRVIATASKNNAPPVAPGAAAAAGKGGAPGAPGAAGAPVAKITWKCKYCGQTNEDKDRKCPNCGADRP